MRRNGVERGSIVPNMAGWYEVGLWMRASSKGMRSEAIRPEHGQIGAAANWNADKPEQTDRNGNEPEQANPEYGQTRIAKPEKG